MITITTAYELATYVYSHMMCTWEYFTICSILSVTLKMQLGELLTYTMQFLGRIFISAKLTAIFSGTYTMGGCWLRLKV